MPRIPSAPLTFDGTLAELYERGAKDVLLPAGVVEDFHQLLSAYMESADPLFLLRMVKGTVRGETLRSAHGAQLRFTDNAPAWWIHRELYLGQSPRRATFEQFIESIPCHMFHIPKGENISVAGWHVAHIFDVKDGNTAFRTWDRAELVRRMVRNIHPCNYFYIPKPEWQRYGGDPTVIAFFCDKMASTYRSIWPEFLRLADGRQPDVPAGAGNYRVLYPAVGTTGQGVPTAAPHRSGGGVECVASYKYARLCFKADVIEPLKMTDRFCVVTDVGTYVLSKQDLYDVFPGVVASASYQEQRIYHFPKPPARARQFRVDAGGAL